MTVDGAIPFLDLVTPHRELEDELVSVFRRALNTAGFVGGPVVDDFERQFAAFCAVDHCIGVASGTDALRFALIAAGVEPGDTVLTVPNTFIATTEAITQAGAHPDFVDIDERTYNMDPAKLQNYLDTRCEHDGRRAQLVNRRTRRPVTAIVPVHLYGQPADMDALQEIAGRYELMVVEDACQAHGAEYFSAKHGTWRRAGSIGRAAAFSFYPGKNLGACGEAGAVTTSDSALAERVRKLRDHGQVRKYHHASEGYNGRLDAIQAGILRVKLEHLADWNRKRRERAHHYDELFSSEDAAIVPPYESSRMRSVYHLYVIRVEDRASVQEHLAQANIATLIHYPIPLHLQAAYADLGYREGDFPVCERVAAEILSLPMYPHLEPAQQRRVVAAIVESSSSRTNGSSRARTLAASTTTA